MVATTTEHSDPGFFLIRIRNSLFCTIAVCMHTVQTTRTGLLISENFCALAQVWQKWRRPIPFSFPRSNKLQQGVARLPEAYPGRGEGGGARTDTVSLLPLGPCYTLPSDSNVKNAKRRYSKNTFLRYYWLTGHSRMIKFVNNFAPFPVENSWVRPCSLLYNHRRKARWRDMRRSGLKITSLLCQFLESISSDHFDCFCIL